MVASQQIMEDKEDIEESNVIEPKVYEQLNGTLVFTKQKKESVNKRTKKSLRKAEMVYVEPILPSYMQNID